MNICAVRTRIFRENEDLVDFIRKAIPKLKNGSVLVVTSKIVALSEGRTAHVRTRKEKEALIKKESTWALQTHPEWWWTEKDGALLVNAGIDDSNADLPRVDSRVKAGGKRVVLLPKDSFKAAALLRKQLRWLYKVKSLGVVITDSRISPMRAGVTGLALGYAGFKGIRDYRGKKDIFGRKLKVTMTDVADSLATAAALVMGEGAEQQPLAIIEDLPAGRQARLVEFTNKPINPKEVMIPAKDDMYAPLFKYRGSRPTSVRTRSRRRKLSDRRR